MKRYAITWKHDFGGANTEYVYAPNKDLAIIKVMSKYSQQYNFISARIY